MNNRLFFKFFVILVCFTFVTVGTCFSKPTDKLHFEQMVINFGKVSKPNAKKIFKLKYKNIGKNAVQIQNVRSSCKCTQTVFSRDPISSKTEGYIRIIFDLTDAPKGQVVKKIFISTDDSAEPVEITLKAIVTN